MVADDSGGMTTTLNRNMEMMSDLMSDYLLDYEDPFTLPLDDELKLKNEMPDFFGLSDLEFIDAYDDLYSPDFNPNEKLHGADDFLHESFPSLESSPSIESSPHSSPYSDYRCAEYQSFTVDNDGRFQIKEENNFPLNVLDDAIHWESRYGTISNSAQQVLADHAYGKDLGTASLNTNVQSRTKVQNRSPAKNPFGEFNAPGERKAASAARSKIAGTSQHQKTVLQQVTNKTQKKRGPKPQPRQKTRAIKHDVDEDYSAPPNYYRPAFPVQQNRVRSSYTEPYEISAPAQPTSSRGRKRRSSGSEDSLRNPVDEKRIKHNVSERGRRGRIKNQLERVGISLKTCRAVESNRRMTRNQVLVRAREICDKFTCEYKALDQRVAENYRKIEELQQYCSRHAATNRAFNARYQDIVARCRYQQDHSQLLQFPILIREMKETIRPMCSKNKNVS